MNEWKIKCIHCKAEINHVIQKDVLIEETKASYCPIYKTLIHDLSIGLNERVHQFGRHEINGYYCPKCGRKITGSRKELYKMT